MLLSHEAFQASRCTNLGSATMPQCLGEWSATHAIVAMLWHALKFSPDVSTPNTIGDISSNSTEQSANIRRCTPRLKMSPIYINDTSATYRRHIGDARETSAIHIRCYNIADGLMIHRRCSRAARRSIGCATAMLRWALEISFLIGHQWSHEHYIITHCKWKRGMVCMITIRY